MFALLYAFGFACSQHSLSYCAQLVDIQSAIKWYFGGGCWADDTEVRRWIWSRVWSQSKGQRVPTKRLRKGTTRSTGRLGKRDDRCKAKGWTNPSKSPFKGHGDMAITGKQMASTRIIRTLRHLCRLRAARNNKSETESQMKNAKWRQKPRSKRRGLDWCWSFCLAEQREFENVWNVKIIASLHTLFISVQIYSILYSFDLEMVFRKRRSCSCMQHW